MTRILSIITLAFLIGCSSSFLNTKMPCDIERNGVTLTFEPEPWWNCSEYGLSAYNQLSPNYKTQIFLGFAVEHCNFDDIASHIWVESIINDETYIFDYIDEDSLRIPILWGDPVIKLIEKEQQYRKNGISAEVCVIYSDHFYVPAVSVRRDDGLYIEEFDIFSSLRIHGQSKEYGKPERVYFAWSVMF